SPSICARSQPLMNTSSGTLRVCSLSAGVRKMPFSIFFFKQKTAYEIGLGIPAEPLFRSFVCLSMVQLMAVFISMRCTLCGHFLQVALTLILVVGYAIAAS